MNKNIKMSSFKSSENIQKKEGGPDRSVSDKQSSSVTLNEPRLSKLFLQVGCSHNNLNELLLQTLRYKLNLYDLKQSRQVTTKGLTAHTILYMCCSHMHGDGIKRVAFISYFKMNSRFCQIIVLNFEEPHDHSYCNPILEQKFCLPAI